VVNAAAQGLAATKLRPPALPDRLVARPRLDALLNGGVGGQVRLVLVSAPAGSGKSTVLASWLADRPQACAWLQVETSDSDPARFWAYLVQALTSAAPGLSSRLAAVVASSAGDESVVVTAVVNALAELEQPLVLVIDDYHLIQSDAVHRGMERLVELSPAGLTLVIATRADPPLRLGRLRVRRQLLELRGDDLRFSVDEAPVLLGPAAARLDDAGREALRERTEGWAAGLVLAGMSLARTDDAGAFVEAFAGDDSMVVEYLRDEYLAALTPQDRQRLLETSLLEQLDAGLVDAVTGGSDGADWLRRTAASNKLVIGLDATGTWFRYHHLLRDLLRLEARQILPGRLPELHARAAACFAGRGEHGRAIEHHVAAGQVPEAAHLMLAHGPRLLHDGQVETLRAILDRLQPLTGQVPGTALLYGWCEQLAGRYDSASEWVDTTLRLAPGGFDPVIAAALRINVSIGRGDVAAALAHAVVVDVPAVLDAQAADLAVAVGASYLWAGRPEDARRAFHLAAAKAAAERFPTALATALTYLSVLALETGSRGSASAAADRAVAAATAVGLAEYHGVAAAYAVRGRAGDDPERRLDDARHAVVLARRIPTTLAHAYVLAAAAETLLDNADAAGELLLAEAQSQIAHCPDPGTAGSFVNGVAARHDAPARRAPAALVEPLTERELAVLRYLPTQLTQRDIAAELYVSVNTVKTQCQSAYRKLGVAGRKAAVQAARDLRLL
jgi:LuxR family transcriptional regulator, maltose regulon positive regulatory protein